MMWLCLRTLEQKLDLQRLSNMFSMSWLEKDKEQKRFYLLPGMGGSAFRRKRRLILLWSVIAGLLVSAALAGILYIMSASAR
jgi:ABC-type multidrug transport system permease subunit